MLHPGQIDGLQLDQDQYITEGFHQLSQTQRYQSTPKQFQCQESMNPQYGHQMQQASFDIPQQWNMPNEVSRSQQNISITTLTLSSAQHMNTAGLNLANYDRHEEFQKHYTASLTLLQVQCISYLTHSDYEDNTNNESTSNIIDK